MCGRFAKFSDNEAIAQGVFQRRLAGPRGQTGYNLPPGTDIATVVGLTAETVTFNAMHWGFRPAWAGSKAPKPINAKAETVASSRYFRQAFAHKRCLVPANGWFEWQVTPAGKQPFYITPATDRNPDAVVFFAAIWEFGDNQHPGCAIITEPAAPSLAQIHPRQPVVLDPACLQDWLNPALEQRDEIRRAIRRLDSAALQAWPVSSAVNLPRNDDASLLAPVEPAEALVKDH